MAANVRYRGTYYNTTGTIVSQTIEILDTEPVSQIINVELSGSPDESFEGLTQDLKPGIYPTSLTFGMYLRSTPKTKGGTTYGPSIGILTDIATSAEGRFLARYSRDGIVHFVGPIIWDQSSYSDEDIPLLQITAVDGMNRLQTVDYRSEVGEIVYYSTKDIITAYDDSPLLYDGPITGVSPMTVIEHTVTPAGLFGAFVAITTFAHREIFSINSPGTGWVFQGQGKWAKTITGSNAVITDNGPVSYHYTLDIDDNKHRTIAEYFKRAIVETNMTGEYISPAVMYDVAMEWREHDMTTGEPTALIRLHEDPMIGGTWHDALTEVCREFNFRLYYSKGRYHFEQISLRDGTTFTRYTFQSDGTYIGTETASLDLNFNTLPVQPGSGGVYKFLAPFKSVEAKITLDGSNLLEGVNWNDGEYGTRYLGRIKRSSGVQKMHVVINSANTSTFDPSVLSLYPQSFLNIICLHVVRCIYSVRLTNITTATTYYLEPLTNGHAALGTWETTEAEITPAGNTFGGENRRFTLSDYGHTIDRKFQVLAEDLPGSEDDMMDIHVSFRCIAEFSNQVGSVLWSTIHVNKFWTVGNTSNNSLRFYSVASYADLTNWVEAETNSELAYICENDVDNSIKVKISLQWADTTQHKKSIEIYNGAAWQPSGAWSIGGVGTAMALLELLAFEIMSLRTLPRKLYSGSYLSTLPNAESRFQRGTSYYLPLSCSKDTDVDNWRGEFLEIARTTPSDVEVIDSPIAGVPIPGLTGQDAPEDFDAGLYFETNEAITAASTLTEVDIVNTLGVYVANGETVSIIHPTTGVSENVTLTQEILPADIIMYFESNVMANSYPDGSYIVLQDGGVSIESGGSKYRYDNRIYNGATHSIPVSLLDLVALDGLTNQHLNNKVWVWRNGQKLIGIDFTALGLVGGIYWWYDSTTNEIMVHADFEYVDEYLGIDIDLNR